MGESTINLPPGSGDLSLHVHITTQQYAIPPFIFNKMQVFHSGVIDGNLYFAKLQFPTFLYLSPYSYVVVGLYIDRCIITRYF